MMANEGAHQSGFSWYCKPSKRGPEDLTGFEQSPCTTSRRDGEKFKWSRLLARFGHCLISLINHWGKLYNATPNTK